MQHVDTRALLDREDQPLARFNVNSLKPLNSQLRH
jgi:hypothetical protein